jgi:catechol 2,3-dioxygenase-like lactoylglutathione lyase family enzyme
MAKLRHIAIATDDPDTTADFYEEVFGLARLRSVDGKWGFGHILSDGTINFAVLKFVTDEAAGVEKGVSFTGLHHLGFEVDDIEASVVAVQQGGGRLRPDITEALGIPHDGPVQGEFKCEDPKGVVFDLGTNGFWRTAAS